ncbi:MAG: PAS domain-containing protein, partial [Myxococcales bacterium]|nr:PAS domain-containing protein [Myxococcales bacterium]
MSPPADLDSPTPWFFAGPGVTPELARQIAWETTPLGPCSGWPTSLKSTLAMLFHASQPMFLWWGPALIQFYNDAYLPSFGRGKHPAAMGQPGRECWQEIWPIIWPQIDDVMARGKASWHQDALVPIERNGRIEEVYWTYSYGPIFSDDGSIGGTLVICTETTARVLAERRMRTLRALADRTALATDLPALLHHAAAALADNNLDIPCAALLTADTVTPILPLPLAPSPSTAALPAALLAATARLVPLASLPLTPI